MSYQYQLSQIKIIYYDRFVPIKHLRDPSHIQKLRLQEFMSGMKHHPELDGVKIKNVHKYKPRASHIEFDPIKSCKILEINFSFPYFNFC